MTDPETQYRELARQEREARAKRSPITSPFAVYQEWQRRLSCGAGDIGEVVDLDGYAECCLGLTDWTRGFGVAAANFQRNILKPFTEMTVAVEEIIEGETSVVLRSRSAATHVGHFLGIPATGRRLQWDNVAIVHVREGRVVGQWVQMDLHGVYRQLRT